MNCLVEISRVSGNKKQYDRIRSPKNHLRLAPPELSASMMTEAQCLERYHP